MDPRRELGRRPAECVAGLAREGAPAREAGGVERHGRHGLQPRAGCGEVAVGSGQAPRVDERRAGRGRVQSSLSRAKRMPRSSRTMPSMPAKAASPTGVVGRRHVDALRAIRRCRRAFGAELDDLLPRARQRVGEDQQQVAGLAHAQRGVDRFLLVGDDRDRVRRHALGLQRARLDARHLVAVAPAQAVVAAADVVVEAAGHRVGDRHAGPRRAGRPARPAPRCAARSRPGAAARSAITPTACALWP